MCKSDEIRSVSVNPFVRRARGTLRFAVVFLLLLDAAIPGLASDLDAFQLPPKAVFSEAMPRYPNLWFYVDASLTGSYREAWRLVTDNLRPALHLREYAQPPGNPEGCDFEARIEHLQPWQDPAHRALQHSHSFHIRYYYSDLERAGLDRVTVRSETGATLYYRLAASAHYEVEHTNPNHADVEICPICGRIGEYAGLTGNLVEMVHDPLGVELVLTGRIRGNVVRFENWNQMEVGSVQALASRFAVQHQVFRSERADQNTLRIGIVMIGPRKQQ